MKERSGVQRGSGEPAEAVQREMVIAWARDSSVIVRNSQFQNIFWWESHLRFTDGLDLKSERKSKIKKDYWILDDGYGLVPFNKMSKIRKRENGVRHFVLTMLNLGSYYISLFSQDRLSYYCCNKYSPKSGGFKLQNISCSCCVCISTVWDFAPCYSYFKTQADRIVADHQWPRK